MKTLLTSMLILSALMLHPIRGEELAPSLPSAQELGQRMSQNLAESLQLTPEQQPQVEAVLVARASEMLDWVEKRLDDPSPRAFASSRTELQRMMQSTREQLEPLLTEEQASQLGSAIEQQKKDLPAEVQLARFREPLALSPEQEAALRPIFAEASARRAELMQPKGGTGGGRPGIRTLMRARDKNKKIEAEVQKQLSAVLDEAQMATYREMQEKAQAQMKAGVKRRFAGR